MLVADKELEVVTAEKLVTLYKKIVVMFDSTIKLVSLAEDFDTVGRLVGVASLLVELDLLV